MTAYMRLITLGLVLLLGMRHAVAGDMALPAPSAHLDGLTPITLTVIEPHESQSFKPVETSYQGYPVSPLLDQLLGPSWRSPAALVGFEAKDGFFSMIPGQLLLQYLAYLVFAKARGGDFVIEVPPLNERVSLAPWYLVWDNVLHPELQADGATYWPYQVTRVGLIDQDLQTKLFPPMLPERYKEGAQLTLKYCLSCHQVNGVGGRKLPIDLAQWARGQSYARFATWVLDPSGKNPLTTMPALANERPAAERQLMARQIYGYLRALGALGK